MRERLSDERLIGRKLYLESIPCVPFSRDVSGEITLISELLELRARTATQAEGKKPVGNLQDKTDDWDFRHAKRRLIEKTENGFVARDRVMQAEGKDALAKTDVNGDTSDFKSYADFRSERFSTAPQPPASPSQDGECTTFPETCKFSQDVGDPKWLQTCRGTGRCLKGSLPHPAHTLIPAPSQEGGMREALEKARSLLSCANQDMCGPVMAEANRNAAWHVLDAALAYDGGKGK